MFDAKQFLADWRAGLPKCAVAGCGAPRSAISNYCHEHGAQKHFNHPEFRLEQHWHGTRRIAPRNSDTLN